MNIPLFTTRRAACSRHFKARRPSRSVAALLAFLPMVFHWDASAQINRCITITCPTNRIVECATPQGTAVTFAPTAHSICGTNVQIVCTPPSGNVFPPGTNNVTCVATDSRSNTTQCGFQVIVRDTTPPAIAAPVQVMANCTSGAGARVEFGVDVWDNCDSAPQVVFTPAPGSLFPIGITPVQCVATDASGNANTNNFTVKVSNACLADCVQIFCPTNIELSLGWLFLDPGPFSDEPALRVYYDVFATNTCFGSNVLVQCTPPSGSLFTLGTHWVTCRVVDGSRKACTFKVVVKDATPPKLTVPPTMNVLCKETLLDGTQGAPVTFLVKATDNADANPTVTCTPPSGSYFRVGSNEVVCVATDASGNATTTSFVINIWWSQACVETPLEQMPDNWGFELGLTAWEAEGDAFADQPVGGDAMPVKRVVELKQQLEEKIGGDYWHDVKYPVGHKGNHWVGTAENIFSGILDGIPPDERTGTLRSKSFILEKPYINFLIGGTRDDMRCRVELMVQTDGPAEDTVEYDGLYYKKLLFETGHNEETMRWESWGVGSIKGKRVVIRILDHSTTGHLNVDDFRFEDLSPQEQQVTIGGQKYPASYERGNLLYHWDSPIWGFADLHTHPMSHLGLGGFIMHGKPDGDVATALGGHCGCSHMGPLDVSCGDFLREIVLKVMDGDGPNPHGYGYDADNGFLQFRSWPVFSSKTHQQMWHEWVRRAYQGGLRVMVALCVNNQLLAAGTKGSRPHDDVTVGNNQIAALTNFVAGHSDFMEIAYDPFQLRDIVRRNKLAVIIGSELDDIGNFIRNPDIDEENPSEEAKKAVRDELDRLYGLGLRYIFPVHLVDNKFGGTPIADDMLNMANKHYNGAALKVESGAVGDQINVYLEDLNFSDEVGTIAVLLTVGAPALPLLLPFVLPIADGILASQGVPPGTGAVGAGLLPIVLLAGTTVLALEAAQTGISPDVYPLGGNYPDYNQESDGWHHGHKNAKGLTDLGEYAIQQMMKRGMMIDIDHMSQKAVSSVLDIAETNSPVGYPLNSGHNSPRDLGLVRGENSRTLGQLNRIRKLGGIFGVGYENGESGGFGTNWVVKQYTRSKIENDCAGASKTFAQYYLYGIEAMQGQGVAFGTDINGFIPGPGPRFGPQAAFGLPDQDKRRYDQILQQYNGVRYTPEHGRPITTPAFVGKGIDAGVNIDYPRTSLGYRYNLEQGDLFAAIRLFHWAKKKVQDGPTDAAAGEAAIKPDLQAAVDALHGAYPNRFRVLLYALGLLRGIHDWPVTSDVLDTEVHTLQLLGKALYIGEVLGEAVPDVVASSSALKPRYERTVRVWQDYHSAFGNNAPLKRCTTKYKQWDINFEGVAHYGLIPDFLQDLHNVGMEPEDMSVLFKSAEHFAQMWTKTLEAAWWTFPRVVQVKPEFHLGTGLSGLLLTLTTDGDEYDLEESNDLDPRSWRPARMEEVRRDGNLRTVKVPADGPSKFYRLRKR